MERPYREFIWVVIVSFGLVILVSAIALLPGLSGLEVVFELGGLIAGLFFPEGTESFLLFAALQIVAVMIVFAVPSWLLVRAIRKFRTGR